MLLYLRPFIRPLGSCVSRQRRLAQIISTNKILRWLTDVPRRESAVTDRAGTWNIRAVNVSHFMTHVTHQSIDPWPAWPVTHDSRLLTTPVTVNCSVTQCCDLETMVSRLDCTRVHFVQVSVSRPEDPGLGLGLKTACLVPMPVARLP